VNEIQLIREQLATERLHVTTVASACAARWPGAADLRLAGTDYLLCVLGWFDARDRRLRELAGTRAVEDALAQPGASAAALEKLQAAQGAPPVAWQALAEFIGAVWGRRRDAIDALLATITRPADWRAIAAIDADSILDERRRFACVNSACPPPALPSERAAARKEAKC
jgi:hypothetical protein